MKTNGVLVALRLLNTLSLFPLAIFNPILQPVVIATNALTKNQPCSLSFIETSLRPQLLTSDQLSFLLANHHSEALFPKFGKALAPIAGL